MDTPKTPVTNPGRADDLSTEKHRSTCSRAKIAQGNRLTNPFINNNPLISKKLLHVIMCSIISNSLAGCGNDSSGDPGPVLNTNNQVCDDESNLDLLTDLNATETFDSITLFHRGIQANYTSAAGGLACGESTDNAQCLEAINNMRLDLANNAIITTQGDQITVYETHQELKTVLGDIDNEKKAFLWLHVSGRDLECIGNASPIEAIDSEQAWLTSYTELTSSCTPISTDRVYVRVDYDGTVSEIGRWEISRSEGACIGRIPPGRLSIHSTRSANEFLVDTTAETTSELGIMFSKHAAYEAASVVAFNHLRDELSHYEAPAHLLNSIQDAANDEVRHAEQVKALADLYGCTATTFTVETGGIRDLKSIALDNLAEGCIGECWGALIGLYQGKNAQTKDIRDVMTAIAMDEVGHASLSWQIHHWLYEQLNATDQQDIDNKLRECMALLEAKVLATDVSKPQQIAGMPNLQQAKRLFADFKARILELAA